MREKVIFEFAEKKFGSKPEYLWKKYPNDAILRNINNKKWYAVIMDVSPTKLGLHGEKHIKIINLKCNTMIIGSLRERKGFFPAYHMNKEHWISVAVDDESISDSEILDLVTFSYNVVDRTVKSIF